MTPGNRLVSLDRLEEAVTHGIITREQLDAILADELEPERSGPPAEARGLSGVSVAYHLGALLVVFAAAWFLIDRWAALRPGGVLAVALGYAGAFAAAAVIFRRRGFALAEGVSATLVVLMVPVIAWALANLLGVWAPYDVRIPLRPPGGAPWDSGRWLIPQLATIAAALAVARVVRYPLVIAPAAFAAWSLTIPLTELLFGLELGGFIVARVSLVIGTLLIAAGYAVDHRTRERGWAFWIYLFGATATLVGMIHTASVYPLVRHLSPIVALAAIAFGLRVGQRLFLVFGVAGLVLYLIHLAFDVFAGTALFPVALAGLGLAIIVATVWLQRSYPALVTRVGGDAGRRVPGDLLTVLVPAVAALLLLLITIPAERGRAESQRLERERIREDMERIDRERRAIEAPPRL